MSVRVAISPCAFVTCSLVGVLVVFAWVATVMPKLRTAWTDSTWNSLRLSYTSGDLRVAGSISRGKDKRSQDERVNVSSLTAIIKLRSLRLWLFGWDRQPHQEPRLSGSLRCSPPFPHQPHRLAALGYSLTLEAGCKVLFGWICFYGSKALVSAPALVSSFKSFSVGCTRICNLGIAAAAVAAALVYSCLLSKS